MDQYSRAKPIANTIYAVGTLITLALSGVAVFGPTEFINPDVMLPMTRRNQAFVALAVGSVPMLLACLAVYRHNNIKASANKKRNLILIFLPGFICASCALFIIGILAIIMVQAVLHILS